MCTSSTDLGADKGEIKRALYDDVDDYNSFRFINEENTLGEKLSSLYPGFNVRITVCYRNVSSLGCSNNIELSKLVTITVTTPQGFDFVFSFFKANF